MRIVRELSVAIALLIFGWCALIVAFASTNNGGVYL
jgi:hypothetical protein